MTDISSKKDQCVVEEVGLADWIKSEPEDASDEEGITWKSLNKPKRQPKPRCKRKPKSNQSNSNPPTINRKSKRQKTKDTPVPEPQIEPQVHKRKSNRKNNKDTTINRKSKRQKTKDTPAPEQQIEPQVLTEDEYIIAYIKEEVEEEEQIHESSNEINSNRVTPDVAIASCASVPEIKEEPPASTEPVDSLISEPKVTTLSSTQLPPTVIPLPEEISPGSITLTPSGTYLCPICTHEYTSPLHLTIHLRSHSKASNGKHPFACPACPTICKSNWLFAQHVTACLGHPKKPIRGRGRPRNDEATPIESAPVKQMVSASKLPQISDEPKLSDPSTVTLNIHTCPHCSKSYILPEYLSQHITSEHPNSELPSSVGDKQAEPVKESPASTIPSKSELPRVKAKKAREPKPPAVKGPENGRYLDKYLKHKCTQCTAKFHFPASLRRHLKSAHGQFDSPAPAPAKRSGRSKKEPKPKPPFELQICPHCQTEYTSKQALEKHISRNHTSPEEDARARTCPECSMGPFESLPILAKHLNTAHSRIKRYVCRHCEASFGEEVNLLKHLTETHTGEHPLCCAPCRLFFDTKGDTEAHLRTIVHTRPPFQCTACGAIVPSQEAQTEPCKMHRRLRAPVPVVTPSISVPPKETPKESLEKLRNTAGPSLDSLAGKLGIA